MTKVSPGVSNLVPLTAANLILMAAQEASESVVCGSWAADTVKMLRTKLVRVLNTGGFQLVGQDCCEVFRNEAKELFVAAWRDFQDPYSAGLLRARCVFEASVQAQSFGSTHVFWDVLWVDGDEPAVSAFNRPRFNAKTAPSLLADKQRLTRQTVYRSEAINQEDLAAAAKARFGAPEVLRAWTRSACEQVDARVTDQALVVLVKQLNNALAL